MTSSLGRLIPYDTLLSPLRATRQDSELAGIRLVLDKLRQSHVCVNPSARLARYARLIAAKSSTSTMSAGLQHTIVADLDEWEQIVSFLPANNAYWRGKIQEAMSGHTDFYAGGRTQARDLQFELYSAACLRRSGATVIPPSHEFKSGASVDFEVVHDRFRMGVEAKRVTSPAKVLVRLKEAEAQLVRSRIAGLIAIDVSRIVQPSIREQDILGEPLPIQEVVESTRDRVYQLINDYAPQLNTTFVLAVWAFCRRCTVVSNPEKPLQVASWYPIQTTTQSDRRRIRVSKLIGKWLARDMKTISAPEYSPFADTDSGG